VGDRYYLLGARILCEADYEQHLRQYGDQLQQLQQPISMTTTPDNHPDAVTSPPWYEPNRQQLVPSRRFYSSSAVENSSHKLVDDRSSGYGSPSPPCV